MSKHISEISPKTAGVLALADLDGDWYHENIKRAAGIIIHSGYSHDFEYVTQYGSGSTLWERKGYGNPIKIETPYFCPLDLDGRHPSLQQVNDMTIAVIQSHYSDRLFAEIIMPYSDGVSIRKDFDSFDDLNLFISKTLRESR